MTHQATHARLIIESDNDLPAIISSITVDFKWSNELVVSLEYQNDERPEYGYIREAVVDSEDTGKLARFLHTQPEHLPDEFFNRFKDTSYCAAPSEVEETFGEILNFILDCGARYQLKERPFDGW